MGGWTSIVQCIQPFNPIALQNIIPGIATKTRRPTKSHKATTKQQTADLQAAAASQTARAAWFGSSSNVSTGYNVISTQYC